MQIPIKYGVLIGTVLVILFFTLVNFGLTAFGQTGRQLPAVTEALPPTGLYQESVAILLLRPSDWFGSEALVSIYRKNNSFELLIGWGFVLTVQENKMIQVVVKKSLGHDASEFWKRICSNDREALASLIVKPSIPRNVAQSLE